jgi:CRISPR-associated protein (TIGR03986 family)
MSTQTGVLSIQFKKNKKGNIQRKNVLIALSSGQPYKFDNIPDPKLAEAQISIALLNEIISVTEEGKRSWNVEFELDGQRVLKLRQQGAAWDRLESETVETVQVPERVRSQEQPKRVQGDRFHNPYNFVPALPRDQVTGELDDRAPVGHGRYLPEYWSGRIAVKLTTVTPLLIPDAAEMTESNDHKTYPVRLGADGKPYLPPTSIKGMLRSAYEAITNSRLSVFEKHDELLAYRLPAKAGTQMVPARIESGQICLYPGTSTISQNGQPQSGDPMYAAWLRRWDRNSTDKDQNALPYHGTQQLPEHGDRVKFWAKQCSKRNFSYWKVQKIIPYSRNSAQQTNMNNDPRQPFEGYVCVTNKNITNKHDERIFFEDESRITIPLTNEMRERWAKLIESYQNNDDFQNGLPCPAALRNADAPRNVATWSRHVTGGDPERELSEGTLCYARVYKNGSGFGIIDLYPVMISRSLYRCTPTEILHPSLKPASNYANLSPADSVFGWVNQNGKGAYKGQLRIHSVYCLRKDAVDNFGSEGASFPLAILGQPKPEQSRFYCADNVEGQPLHHGKDNPLYKDKGEGYYDEDQSLRGRKIYPHQKGLAGNYWNNPLEDRTQQYDNTNRYQEYRRPQKDGVEQLDKQNRSIQGWVKPETEFRFEIDITNLSPVELGALLWLLSSPDIHYHRLGGAKPLGFGSVWLNVDWECTDLRLGSDWATFYQSLRPLPQKVGNGVSCIEAFKKAVTQAYGNGKRFEQVRFIAAFCNSSQGFDDAAIHYPRVTPNPTPEGEAFKWFIRNEQDTGGEEALKIALPDLAVSGSGTLPLNPSRPRQNDRQRRG